MTHLGLGPSLEEPWECLVGGSRIVAFPGGGVDLQGGLGGPMPGGGHLLPCLRVLLLLLARPAWVLGGLGGLLPSDEGRRALA